MLVYGGAAVAAFLVAFLKTFNLKNIVGRHYWPAAATSVGITTCEGTTVLLVVHSGWTILIATGIGGAVGVVVGMWLHDRLFIKKVVHG